MSTVRWASPDDAASMLRIYAPIVENEATSFEIEPPSVGEFAQRISEGAADHPWLVAIDDDGAVMGYTYASALRGRPAYQWSAETTIYISPRHLRRGVGSTLYRALHRVLVARNIANLFASIVVPNDASVALHERLGYVRVGTFPAVGHKFGRWHDTGWWHLNINGAAALAPPRAMADLRADLDVARSLNAEALG